MSLYTLIKFELKKLFKQKSNYIGMVILLSVCLLYFVLAYLNRPAGTYMGTDLVMDTIYIASSVLFVFPLIAILLAANSLAAEYSSGTLLTIMTRPLKRENIVISKFIALLVYLSCAAYALLAVSLLLGVHWGYPENILWFVPRMLAIYFLYVLGAMVLVALTFVVASFGIKPVTTALIALGFYMGLIILESFAQVQKLIFSYHISTSIQLLVVQTMNLRDFYQSLAVILIYILAFLLIGSTLLEKRDMTA